IEQGGLEVVSVMLSIAVVRNLKSAGKVFTQLSSSLFLLLCLSAQTDAQSTPATATTTRQTQTASINQPSNAKPYIAPTYLTFGKSVKGRDITAMIYGAGKKRVLVFGGIHGDEQNTTVVARSLAVHLNTETLPQNLTVIILPDVNPDGLMAQTRVNANGVDINRNFP